MVYSQIRKPEHGAGHTWQTMLFAREDRLKPRNNHGEHNQQRNQYGSGAGGGKQPAGETPVRGEATRDTGDIPSSEMPS